MLYVYVTDEIFSGASTDVETCSSRYNEVAFLIINLCSLILSLELRSWGVYIFTSFGLWCKRDLEMPLQLQAGAPGTPRMAWSSWRARASAASYGVRQARRAAGRTRRRLRSCSPPRALILIHSLVARARACRHKCIHVDMHYLADTCTYVLDDVFYSNDGECTRCKLQDSYSRWLMHGRQTMFLSTLLEMNNSDRQRDHNSEPAIQRLDGIEQRRTCVQKNLQIKGAGF